MFIDIPVIFALLQQLEASGNTTDKAAVKSKKAKRSLKHTLAQAAGQAAVNAVSKIICHKVSRGNFETLLYMYVENWTYYMLQSSL